MQSYSRFQTFLSQVFCLCDTILSQITPLTTDSELTINRIQRNKSYEKTTDWFHPTIVDLYIDAIGRNSTIPLSYVF